MTTAKPARARYVLVRVGKYLTNAKPANANIFNIDTLHASIVESFAFVGKSGKPWTVSHSPTGQAHI
jgi:hypothetical protein